MWLNVFICFDFGSVVFCFNIDFVVVIWKVLKEVELNNKKLLNINSIWDNIKEEHLLIIKIYRLRKNEYIFDLL